MNSIAPLLFGYIKCFVRSINQILRRNSGIWHNAATPRLAVTQGGSQKEPVRWGGSALGGFPDLKQLLSALPTSLRGSKLRS
ncbi:hypothetical protein LC608_07395 [Nostoc sp. XA010]|uniref:hypothetical protein n=1 Tax=Nostoc sp. XA010 TaxID=2780407 RepID=UPI001E604166|nr:hypothetical protein [Nostoc sp. XA010]MCC5656813.1 hypothetical protein [Nostoc sp. XA010]